MLLIDLEEGRIISDEEVKTEIANEFPYQKWLEEELVQVDPDPEIREEEQFDDLLVRQKAFGYTYEDIQKYLIPVIKEGKDPLGSMGNDSPLAVLSDRAQSLFHYFKQLFAQVTNPPIDAIREQLVTSTVTWLGAEGDLLHPSERNARRIKLYTPVLSNEQFYALKTLVHPDIKSQNIRTLFSDDLEKGLKDLFQQAEKAIKEGVSLLILSDRAMSKELTPLPPLLAVSALHQHLIHQGLRTKASIIVESGEAREVHHFAALIGYGADAVNPYLTYATYKQEIDEGLLDIPYEEAVSKYGKSVTEGVVKVMSKMGISTVQSYRGAQIFEAVGIGEDVIAKYFTGTASQLGGIDIETIAQEAKQRHQAAYKDDYSQTLDPGSEFQWRNGESTTLSTRKPSIRCNGPAEKMITACLSSILKQRMKNESDFYAICSPSKKTASL